MVNAISTDSIDKDEANCYLDRLVKGFCLRFGLTYKASSKINCLRYDSSKSKLKLTDIKDGIFINSSNKYVYYSKDYIINGVNSEVLTICLTNIDREFAILGSFVGLMNGEHLRVKGETELFYKIRDLHKCRPTSRPRR